MRLAVCIIGPLNADRLRRAKTRLDVGEDISGVGIDSLNVDRAPPLPSFAGGSRWLGPRTSRTLLGKRAEAPGVVGRTLSEERGDFDEIWRVGVDVASDRLEETEDVLEWLCV